jgi:hypothetical protein
MSCSNGREAVELLIKSDRIQGDLETYADSANNANENEPFNLIIREFVPFDVSLARSGKNQISNQFFRYSTNSARSSITKN